jgi:hypothetical protein
MKELFDLNSFFVNAENVGDWNGKEALAASNLNSIYQAVYDAAPVDVDLLRLHDLMKHIHNYWGKKVELLNITENQINEFAHKLFPLHVTNYEPRITTTVGDTGSIYVGRKYAGKTIDVYIRKLIELK